MVKKISKAPSSPQANAKRVHIVRFRTIPNKSKKHSKRFAKRIRKKCFDINYYIKSLISILLSEEESSIEKLRRSEDSEYSGFDSSNSDKYKRKDRELAIIGLIDMIYQIIRANPNKANIFPESLIPSVMSLFDYYLRKVEKQLSKSEVIKALFSAVIYIDMEKNLNIFNRFLLNNFKLSLDFLEVVDLNLYPIKIYDYFEVFFLRISQTEKDVIKHIEYIKEFRRAFLEFAFYLNFHNDSRKYRPYYNFISCLLMTRNFLKNYKSLEDEIVNYFIDYYKKTVNYDPSLYLSCCTLVKESKYLYNNYLNLMNVNSMCKQGMISIYNLDYI